MIVRKSKTELNVIEGIWKNSEDILSENEISLIHKTLKLMLSQINEIKETQKGTVVLTEREFFALKEQFEDPINSFVTCFDFNRIQSFNYKRNIAKYSYHILTCILNILEKSKVDNIPDIYIHSSKAELYKSCQICLNYYFPSKAIKIVENFTTSEDSSLSRSICKKTEIKAEDYNNDNICLTETPPKTSTRTSQFNLPKPSPFHTAIGSPSNRTIEFRNGINTRYNSFENFSAEFGNKSDNTYDESLPYDSEFFPNEFQLPLPIEEAKRRLREKLMKKEVKGLNYKVIHTRELNSMSSSFDRRRQLSGSWGSEHSDNSDLQIEDLVSLNNSTLKIKSKIQITSNMECARVASELAETLNEPNRTKRIRKEIYQQSIERSIELLKSLGICYNLKPDILSKKMFHTIEQITDYS